MLKNTRLLSTVAAVGFGVSLLFTFISYVTDLIIMRAYHGVTGGMDFINILSGMFSTFITAAMIITLVLNREKFFFSIPTVIRAVTPIFSIAVSILNLVNIITMVGADYISDFAFQIIPGYTVSILSSLLAASGYFMLAVLGVCYTVEGLRGKYLSYVWFIPGIFLGITVFLNLFLIAYNIIAPVAIYGNRISFMDLVTLLPSLISILGSAVHTVAVLSAGKWSVTGNEEPAPVQEPVQNATK